MAFTHAALMWFLLAVVLFLTAANADHLPDLKYDVTSAKIWKCLAVPRRGQAGTGHHTVLTRNKYHQYILASENENFKNCTVIANTSTTSDLFNEIPSAAAARTRRDINDASWFQSYHNLSTIHEWYRQLAEQYPSRLTIKTIGTTANGRSLLAVHITDDQQSIDDIPVVYVQCLLHPREWITGPVCMSLTHLLATTTDIKVRALINQVQFVIVPVANPDGYYLTWKSYPKYRLWRKNLSTSSGSSCLGVDLNRNFAIKWSKYGSSINPCSDTYQGSQAESELEVSAITRYLLHYPQPVIGALDFHSFSQAIIYPYGWTKRQAPANIQLLKYIAKLMARSVKDKHGTSYSVEQMGSVYLASGTFTDWLISDQFVHANKDKFGQHYRPIPLTVELPPTNNHPVTGFMVPPAKILSICDEIVPAIIKFTSLLTNHRRNAIDY